MRSLASAGALLLLTATICAAADPVSLLLKALAPVPLSFTGPQPPVFDFYQHATSLNDTMPTVQRKPKLVQSFIYDPVKFDDLSARYELYQTSRESSRTLLLQNSFDEMAAAATMNKVMDEYFRRVYQGYSSSITGNEARVHYDGDSVLDVGRNIIVGYQSVRLSDALEARMSYDVIGHSTHLKLVLPWLEAEGIYYSIDQRSPAAIPESVVLIDDAMDEFTRYERTSAGLAHSFDRLGLRLKARYGADTQTVDYGFSEKIVGPLAVQIVREQNLTGDASDSFTFQLTLAKRF